LAVYCSKEFGDSSDFHHFHRRDAQPAANPVPKTRKTTTKRAETPSSRHH
jgi:hypothetical protein